MSENGCVTTLEYTGPGHTSNAVIQMYGNAVIDASGSGALILTSNITVPGSCVETLTLTGTSASDNEISGAIQDSSSGLSVEKTGPGVWILSGSSSYSGQLRVLGGTLVIAANVQSQGASPFGISERPEVGGDTPCELLFVGGLNTISRGFDVVAGTASVVIGTKGAGAVALSNGISVGLERSVTLQAVTGESIQFLNQWDEPANPINITIGAVGNTGTVKLDSFLPEDVALLTVFSGVSVELELGGNETIYSKTFVVMQSSSSIDLGGTDQPLENLEISSGTISNGTLETLGVVTSFGSSTISADVEIGTATEIDVTGSLLISGDVSGSGSIEKSGSGTLTLSGVITYTGATLISDGTLIVEQIHDGSPDVSQATFTDTTLEVAFTTTPDSAATYQLLGGATTNSYTGQVTLTNAGGATGTYDSSTSTLTIN